MLGWLEHLRGNLLAMASSSPTSHLDFSFITPNILALGEFGAADLHELRQVTKGEPLLMWNLGSMDLPAGTREALFQQVLDTPWHTPCLYTKAPTVEAALAMCCAVKAWYDLGEGHVAALTCPTQYPHTGVLVACFLKYIGAFESAERAYDFYSSRRQKDSPTKNPAYRTFFENIDRAVDLQAYPNTHPLLLRSLSISGLPVEDVPVVEVWDANGRVFCSHVGFSATPVCSWNPEYGDGAFRVCQQVLGDFAVVVRFGGAVADSRDRDMLIFKYQHCTAFLQQGELCLGAEQVDVNPQYS
eukprot:CAMPEP_0173263680 /NCGR_PEP_ID=MMETSP1142-20121109/27520_1 /TAXON_ID=483371 /ORGANISM="non described non described, Strain CCMP2298" /LENGTH=299 /DNA_ID=CAMNT_0014199067 /DNA_START=256 /DNA_END=1152 /DNA_ORIENTATION=-